MSKPEIKRGDVVHLKSGSTRLVVTDITEFADKTNLSVMWMVFETATIQTAIVPLDCVYKDGEHEPERKSR